MQGPGTDRPGQADVCGHMLPVWRIPAVSNCGPAPADLRPYANLLAVTVRRAFERGRVQPPATQNFLAQ
jgi:hypothetical protein